MKPTVDPPDLVLDEIHETRRRLLRQHGGVTGLAAFLREQEAKTDRELHTPKSPGGSKKAMHRSRNKRAAEG